MWNNTNRLMTVTSLYEEEERLAKFTFLRVSHLVISLEFIS